MKKIDQKHLWGEKVGQNQNHKLKIFEIEKFRKFRKIFIEFCMKMKKMRYKKSKIEIKFFHFHTNFNDIFSKFPKIFRSQKFSTYDFHFDLKILPINVFARFFLNRFKFSWRRQWRRPEVPKTHAIMRLPCLKVRVPSPGRYQSN